MRTLLAAVATTLVVVSAGAIAQPIVANVEFQGRRLAVPSMPGMDYMSAAELVARPDFAAPPTNVPLAGFRLSGRPRLQEDRVVTLQGFAKAMRVTEDELTKGAERMLNTTPQQVRSAAEKLRPSFESISRRLGAEIGWAGLKVEPHSMQVFEVIRSAPRYRLMRAMVSIRVRDASGLDALMARPGLIGLIALPGDRVLFAYFYGSFEDPPLTQQHDAPMIRWLDRLVAANVGG